MLQSSRSSWSSDFTASSQEPGATQHGKAECSAANFFHLLCPYCCDRPSFRSLQSSWLVGLLALWHTFLLCVAASAIVCFSAYHVLHFHVWWYGEWTQRNLKVNESTCLLIVQFIAVFFGSCALLNAASEALRFCYLLAVDAWRSFEAYRKVVTFQAEKEVEAHAFYVDECAVPGRHRHLDLFVQLMLFASLDVAPAILFFSRSFSPYCLAASLAHVYLFYAAWTLQSVHVVWKRFTEAWQLARTSSEQTVIPTWDIEFQRQEGSRETLHRSSQKHETTTASNVLTCLCAVCYWLEDSFILILPPCIVAVSVASALPTMVTVTGLILTLEAFCCRLHLGYARMRFIRNDETLWLKRSILYKWFPNPGALQYWSERYCGLGIQKQKQSKSQLCRLLVLLCLTMAYIEADNFACACLFLILCQALPFHLWIYLMPFCWLAGLCGSFAAFVIQETLVIWSAVGSSGCDAFCLAVGFAACSFLKQTADYNALSSGNRIRFAARMFFMTIHFVLICLVAASMVEITKGTQRSWSSFCDASSPGCKYYDVPYTGDQNNNPLCSMRFPLGSDEGSSRTLSVADFGVLSSLTYEEDRASLQYGLQHYLLGWNVTIVPGLQFGAGHHGVGTTLYEFSSEDNSTSVFAVQGTASAEATLQDLNLWLIAGLLQGLDMIFPSIHASHSLSKNFASPIAAVAHCLNTHTPHHGLLKFVERRMRSMPKRSFYITGHSLGGGIANLVAGELGDRLQLQAIAFSAPGTKLTREILFGQKEMTTNSLRSINLHPQGDIVPRIDIDTGIAIPSSCDGSFVKCHSIFTTLCSIYKECGSSVRSNLSIPCGQCEGMPCK